MEQEASVLLDVLKSFVREEKLNIANVPDWNRLLRLSVFHASSGILGYVAMETPGEETAPFLPVLKQQCIACVTSGVQRYSSAEALISRLSAAGIDVLPFKGFVVSRYYPVPELRTFGDTDLLIRPADRERCHALMLELGFSVKTDWEPVYSYYREQEIYEIHTALMEAAVSDTVDCRGYFADVWANAVPVGDHRFELNPEYHFLYLMAHIAKHVCGSGAGIRMYMDLAVFIRHFGDALDWKHIASGLNALGLQTFSQYALTLTQRCLGVASPISLPALPEDRFLAFTEFTMAGGVFGKIGRDGGLISLAGASDRHSTRAGVFLRRLFPSVETLERRYTYLQRFPWLLPFAWVHRLFRTRSGWAKHAREAKSILTTDADAVVRLREIRSDLGL